MEPRPPTGWPSPSCHDEPLAIGMNPRVCTDYMVSSQQVALLSNHSICKPGRRKGMSLGNQVMGQGRKEHRMKHDRQRLCHRSPAGAGLTDRL